MAVFTPWWSCPTAVAAATAWASRRILRKLCKCRLPPTCLSASCSSGTKTSCASPCKRCSKSKGWTLSSSSWVAVKPVRTTVGPLQCPRNTTCLVPIMALFFTMWQCRKMSEALHSRARWNASRSRLFSYEHTCKIETTRARTLAYTLIPSIWGRHRELHQGGEKEEKNGRFDRRHSTF